MKTKFKRLQQLYSVAYTTTQYTQQMSSGGEGGQGWRSNGANLHKTAKAKGPILTVSIPYKGKCWWLTPNSNLRLEKEKKNVVRHLQFIKRYHRSMKSEHFTKWSECIFQPKYFNPTAQLTIAAARKYGRWGGGEETPPSNLSGCLGGGNI